MSDPREDDVTRELMALEAVDALDDDERAELEAALADRPDLRTELALLRETAAWMADGVSEPPPTQLRTNVLEAIAATPQAQDEPPPPEELAPVVPIRRRHRWLTIGAAAAAIIAIVIGVVVALPIDGDDVNDQIAAVLDDAGATTIEMPGQLAGLAIVYSADEQAAVLTADGLPVPSGERVYELWAIRGSNPPEPVDTFRPDASGDVALYLPEIDPASAVWAVTEEPAGGSPAPTGDILNSTA